MDIITDHFYYNMHFLLTLAIEAGEEYDSRQQGRGLLRCCPLSTGNLWMASLQAL